MSSRIGTSPLLAVALAFLCASTVQCFHTQHHHHHADPALSLSPASLDPAVMPRDPSPTSPTLSLPASSASDALPFTGDFQRHSLHQERLPSHPQSPRPQTFSSISTPTSSAPPPPHTLEDSSLPFSGRSPRLQPQDKPKNSFPKSSPRATDASPTDASPTDASPTDASPTDASAEADDVTIAIVGINDIHGSALPRPMQRADTQEAYTQGGLATMASLIQTIQSEYPGRTLVLDAGDQFQGGLEASPTISAGQIMNDFYEEIGLAAAALGNHEFDFGPSFMLPYLAARSMPLLLGNLRDDNGAAVFLPNQKTSQLFTLAGGIKIGVLGLVTVFTPQTTNAFKEKLFPPYSFKDYTPVVVAESRKLRSQGAQAVVVLSHVGNACKTSNRNGLWTADNSNIVECAYDEVSQLIDSLPAGTIDAVVQGHRHNFAHHYYRSVPFMGTVNAGGYFNVLYLRFLNGKLASSSIEGPVPVCERVFRERKTCEYLDEEALASAGPLENWTFHGVPVKPNARIQAIYDQEWLPRMQPYRKLVVQNEVYLETNSNQEMELGNLGANLYQAAVPTAQVAILNPGGFRTIWLPGLVLEEDFYNMFPFNNRLISFDMLGSELLEALRIVQSGSNGFYSTFGLQITVSLASQSLAPIARDLSEEEFDEGESSFDEQILLKHPHLLESSDQPPPRNAALHSHPIQPAVKARSEPRLYATATKTFVSATWLNGSSIDPKATVRVVSNDFLVNGGDDFSKVMGKVYTLRNSKDEGDLKVLLREELKKLGTIRKNTLIDPQHRRLIVLSQRSTA